MKIAIAGVTGNMGQQTLFEILKLENIESVKLLVSQKNKHIGKLLRTVRKHRKKIELVRGNIQEKEACKLLVQDVDYVINMAAVIPPHSDQNPEAAIACNQIGVDLLVSEIEKLENQPKLIHISTVALYGNRNHLHPWARVGDPLLVSSFDIYSATKLRGEFRVLESNIKNWVVLRQTAMLHKHMLSDNMSDGLMFHTCFNAPLEWLTAHDSGLLIANILKQDQIQDLSKVFWKKCFNMGAGAKNRNTGYQSITDGLKLIGGTVKDFFQPNFNATRNFHGVWFYDADVLENLFHYQTESTADFWNSFKKSHKYFSVAKIVPKKWISKLVIQRLFKSPNSPAYWNKHKDHAKMTAYFGSQENYDNLPKSWENFGLLCENRLQNCEEIDFQKLLNIENAKMIDLGFDFSKSDAEISLEDLQAVAKMHGGKLVTKNFDGDMYQKLEWCTQDNQRYVATAYTVLRAGHWHSSIYDKNVWDFDRLCKKDKIFAQLWLDSHDQNENNLYCMEKDFTTKIKGKNKKK